MEYLANFKTTPRQSKALLKALTKQTLTHPDKARHFTNFGKANLNLANL